MGLQKRQKSNFQEHDMRFCPIQGRNADHLKYIFIATICIFAIVLVLSCKQEKQEEFKTVLSRVRLIQDPAAKKHKRVPRGLMQRGEYVKVLKSQDFKGASYDFVQIEGVDTKGWVRAGKLRKGKLTSGTVTRDSDLYTRPNLKSPKAGKARAGQVAFKIEEKGAFILIQYPGREGYIERMNFGGASQVVREISIPTLGKAQVNSSSQWKSGEGKETAFDPRNLFDGKLPSGWSENKDGDGVGESVSLNFTNWVVIEKIEIINGLARNEESYKRNNRVAAMRVEADQGRTRMELADENYDYQSFDVSLEGRSFRFIIDGVHKGKVRDTCFSELKVRGRVGTEPEAYGPYGH